MKCHNCDVQRPLHSSQTILGPLPLAISGNNSGRDISSHLKQFFKTEAIEIKCENKSCSTFDRPKFKNRVEQKIISAPEVLMIQLKCYRSQGKMTSKANPNINYGLWLDLSDYASKELREEGNLKYKLSSVIFHQGHSLNSGHYVGTFVGPTGVHKISDASVHKSSLSALLPNKNTSGTPYILTYTRTRGEAQGSQPQK
jgi:ubiquitin carboxyl-terminal hydrolase 10